MNIEQIRPIVIGRGCNIPKDGQSPSIDELFRIWPSDEAWSEFLVEPNQKLLASNILEKNKAKYLGIGFILVDPTVKREPEYKLIRREGVISVRLFLTPDEYPNNISGKEKNGFFKYTESVVEKAISIFSKNGNKNADKDSEMTILLPRFCATREGQEPLEEQIIRILNESGSCKHLGSEIAGDFEAFFFKGKSAIKMKSEIVSILSKIESRSNIQVELKKPNGKVEQVNLSLLG